VGDDAGIDRALSQMFSIQSRLCNPRYNKPYSMLFERFGLDINDQYVQKYMDAHLRYIASDINRGIDNIMDENPDLSLRDICQFFIFSGMRFNVMLFCEKLASSMKHGKLMCTGSFSQLLTSQCVTFGCDGLMSTVIFSDTLRNGEVSTYPNPTLTPTVNNVNVALKQYDNCVSHNYISTCGIEGNIDTVSASTPFFPHPDMVGTGKRVPDYNFRVKNDDSPSFNMCMSERIIGLNLVYIISAILRSYSEGHHILTFPTVPNIRINNLDKITKLGWQLIGATVLAYRLDMSFLIKIINRASLICNNSRRPIYSYEVTWRSILFVVKDYPNECNSAQVRKDVFNISYNHKWCYLYTFDVMCNRNAQLMMQAMISRPALMRKHFPAFPLLNIAVPDAFGYNESHYPEGQVMVDDDSGLCSDVIEHEYTPATYHNMFDEAEDDEVNRMIDKQMAKAKSEYQEQWGKDDDSNCIKFNNNNDNNNNNNNNNS